MARREDAHLSWGRVGPWLAVVGGSIVISLIGWSLKATIANGEQLAAIRSEMIVRVRQGEIEHASFVKRDELIEIVKRLDGTLGELRDELREQRRRR